MDSGILSSGTRISLKHSNPNPLFQSWIEELLQEAKARNSDQVLMLEEALTSLTKYPIPLETAAECGILKGFNKHLCVFLDKRLQLHNQELSNAQQTRPDNSTHISNPQPSTSGSNNTNRNNDVQTSAEPTSEPELRNGINILTNTTASQFENNNWEPHNPTSNLPTQGATQIHVQWPASLRKKCKKPYNPKYRSGGYAILMTLLQYYKENPTKPTLEKEQLIALAQPHCEESFTRPRPETHYTAWSTMGNLVEKQLVQRTRKKKAKFSLTDEGLVLAMDLYEATRNRPTMNDIIFNEAPNTGIANQLVDPTPSGSNIDEETIVPIIDVAIPVPPERMVSEELKVIEMTQGSYDIILLIDKNETGGCSKNNDPTVAQFNKYPDLKHEYRSLKVGDFTWIARHKVNQDQEIVLPYIVERKRMDDLGASIKDGRFHEQKFRLKKCGLANVIYMVENYGSNKFVGLPVQTLMQALANTRVQDRFKVHVTASLTHSARFLAIMTKRLTIEFKDKHLTGWNRDPNAENMMIFQYFNKSAAKTKPLTVTETFIKTLLQLKGCSVEKALAITAVYKTPQSLMRFYESCDAGEGEMALAGLRLAGSSQNVGPSVSKVIYNVFGANSIWTQNN